MEYGGCDERGVCDMHITTLELDVKQASRVISCVFDLIHGR
jgi:hypothetical protein